MTDTTIPQSPVKAIARIIAIDDEQLSQGSGGVGHKKYEDWKWIQAESDMWTSVRDAVEPFFQPYINKKNINTEERNFVKEKIQLARDYSCNDVNGHRLFLKIAAFGNNHDWTVAGIKYGTPLAKKPSVAKSDSPGLLTPKASIVQNVLGGMRLKVVNLLTPNSKKLPDGIKFAKVYRYIGISEPTSPKDFLFYGNVKRGYLDVTFDGIDLTGEEKLRAYYFARYESNKGELGLASETVSAGVLFE